MCVGVLTEWGLHSIATPGVHCVCLFFLSHWSVRLQSPQRRSWAENDGLAAWETGALRKPLSTYTHEYEHIKPRHTASSAGKDKNRVVQDFTTFNTLCFWLSIRAWHYESEPTVLRVLFPHRIIGAFAGEHQFWSLTSVSYFKMYSFYDTACWLQCWLPEEKHFCLKLIIWYISVEALFSLFPHSPNSIRWHISVWCVHRNIILSSSFCQPAIGGYKIKKLFYKSLPIIRYLKEEIPCSSS